MTWMVLPFMDNKKVVYKVVKRNIFNIIYKCIQEKKFKEIFDSLSRCRLTKKGADKYMHFMNTHHDIVW